MKVIDPGHIYELDKGTEVTRLTFVKRSGGAIHYPKEWSGVQTQAVIRALITHVQMLEADPDVTQNYALWQLGNPETFTLTICDMIHVGEIIDVLEDRSHYLDRILPCVETKDACGEFRSARTFAGLVDDELFGDDPLHEWIVDALRQALWSYEARAYRRKQEKVNREEPAHDDTQRLKAWRHNPAADVPFGPEEIELRPIGPDGHIVLEKT